MALEVSSDMRNMSFGSQNNLPLVNEWQFWLDTKEDTGSTTRSALGVISTIKLFWWFYDNIQAKLPEKATIQLFKNGIEPNWGHPRNIKGGHYKIKCKTQAEIQRLWLDVALVLIGEQFEDSQDINGASCNFTKQTVMFWLADAEDEDVKQQIRKELVCLLPAGATIAFGNHSSLLGKEAVLVAANRLVETDPIPISESAPTETSRLHSKGIAIDIDLIPPTTHRLSRSCPDIFDELELEQSSVPLPAPTRPRSFSECGVFDEITTRRGRSWSRVNPYPNRRRGTSGVGNGLQPPGMRKVLSANALDEYIPREPIHTSVPGTTLRHVKSWADDGDSDISSRCLSPTHGCSKIDDQYERHPLSFPLQQNEPPRSSPQRGFYDEYPEWESGPPSLAHSGPVSPAGPQHMHNATPIAPPGQMDFSLGGPMIPSDENIGSSSGSPSSDRFKTELTNLMYSTQMLASNIQQMAPQQNVRSSLVPIPVVQSNQTHPQQQHPQGQRGMQQQQNVHWVMPTFPMQQQPAPAQGRQQPLHQLNAQHLKQLSQQHHLQPVQQQPQQPPQSTSPKKQPKGQRMRGGIATGGPAGVIHGSGATQGNQFNWDANKIMEFLLESDPASPVLKADDDYGEKYSKSRSPRNRRKIRERKIREAAYAAKREMEIWTPVCDGFYLCRYY